MITADNKLIDSFHIEKIKNLVFLKRHEVELIKQDLPLGTENYNERVYSNCKLKLVEKACFLKTITSPFHTNSPSFIIRKLLFGEIFNGGSDELFTKDKTGNINIELKKENLIKSLANQYSSLPQLLKTLYTYTYIFLTVSILIHSFFLQFPIYPLLTLLSFYLSKIYLNIYFSIHGEDIPFERLHPSIAKND